MAALEAAGEIARMERVSDTPRPTTAAETELNADPTYCSRTQIPHIAACQTSLLALAYTQDEEGTPIEASNLLVI